MDQESLKTDIKYLLAAIRKSKKFELSGEELILLSTSMNNLMNFIELGIKQQEVVSHDN